MKKMTRKIIFDFDGVIVDSFEFAYTVNLIKNPDLSRQGYRKLFVGNYFEEAEKNHIVENIDYYKEYQKFFENLIINNNIKAKIINLSKENRLYIVSSNLTKVIEDFLEDNDLLEFFEKVLGSDVSKSKVDKFEMIFGDEDKNSSVFVTDTTGDIKEARVFGIGKILAVWEWTWQSKEVLEKENPDFLLKSVSDINLKKIF